MMLHVFTWTVLYHYNICGYLRMATLEPPEQRLSGSMWLLFR